MVEKVMLTRWKDAKGDLHETEALAKQSDAWDKAFDLVTDENWGETADVYLNPICSNKQLGDAIIHLINTSREMMKESIR